MTSLARRLPHSRNGRAAGLPPCTGSDTLCHMSNRAPRAAGTAPPTQQNRWGGRRRAGSLIGPGMVQTAALRMWLADGLHGRPAWAAVDRTTNIRR